MTRLFLSLFIVLTLGLFFIRQSGEWLYQNLEHTEHNAQNNIEQIVHQQLASLLRAPSGMEQENWIESLSLKLNHKVSRLAKDQIALAQGQTAALTEGQIVTFESNENQVFILAPLDTEHYLQVGPITLSSSPTTDSDSAEWLHLLSYVLLAGLVLIWSHPLWRDLKKLINDAEKIGSGHYEVKTDINKTSVVYPLSTTLQSMSNKIRDLIALQKQMTHAVSHDIRTPLARLKFSLAILTGENQNTNTLPKVSHEMLKDVAEIENLIDEMLTYGRLESNKVELNLEQVNIHQLTENLCFKLNRNSPLEISLNCPENVTLVCDGHFVERALQNILVNALRYASKQIVFTVQSRGQNIAFQIEDDGPGIDEVDWNNVFLPFVRVEASRNKSSGGFGLGLAIVAKIVGWHSGSVTTERSALGGAQFTLVFPNAPK